MPSFRFQGRTTRGEAVDGVIEADSADSLADHLFARGITPTDIAPAKHSEDIVEQTWRRLGGGRPQTNDLIMFSRQMYALTRSGLPLLRGMSSLAVSTPNAVLRETLEQVLDKLQSGRDLASSLSQHPEVFSKFYVSIVRVGESTGNLPMAFMRMYEYLSMEKRIRDKLKQAMRYPSTVIGAIAVAMVVITLFVLPKFEPIFASLGPNVPWATRVLLSVSDFVAQYWYIVAAGLITSYVAFRMWSQSRDGRYRWDKAKLRFPVVGEITRKATLAKVCRSFALTIDAGVPIVQGLSLIARATGNEYMSEGVLSLRSGVEHGESLSQTAQTSGLFTPLALQMLMIGEETGTLSEMIVEVADFYEREVDYDLENISAAIEPMLIVSVGVMVLVLALGIFLPLWDMAAAGGGFG
ncbi:MAG: type II secretion system F family protein [Gammaproteobacteria bacterium]|jgi:MSHA biogenesis protein MshG